MRKLRDFRCDECKQYFEVFIGDEVRMMDCNDATCNGIAYRMLSAPKCFQNTTGKSPSSSNKKQ